MGALCHRHPDQDFFANAAAKSVDDPIETQFYQRFPKIGDTVRQISKDYPKSWKIDKQQYTILQAFRCYLGKSKLKATWNGCGIMLYLQQGFYYIGNWHNGYKSGLGIMIDENGSYYKGEWIKDEPNGYGEYYDGQNKRIYKGKWRKGKKHGKGEETFPDGVRYEGEFENDVKKGRGKFFFSDKCYFQGIFDNDIACSFGTQRGTNYVYEGKWENSDMNGAAKVTYFDARDQPEESYVGQFVDGKKHGYGEYKWKDGRVYKGEWDMGVIHNKGVFMDPHV